MATGDARTSKSAKLKAITTRARSPPESELSLISLHLNWISVLISGLIFFLLFTAVNVFRLTSIGSSVKNASKYKAA